jgi:GntR family transcriptional regulator/MocR family aminotransferase
VRRVPSSLPTALLPVDPAAPEPLYHQLYVRLRAAILAHRFRPGQRLPSTRLLAADLGVSRNTVLYAFEQLTAEGYLEGAVGSGTYVAHQLPEMPPLGAPMPLTASAPLAATNAPTPGGWAVPVAAGSPAASAAVGEAPPQLSACEAPPQLSACETPPQLSACETPPQLSACGAPPWLSACGAPPWLSARGAQISALRLRSAPAGEPRPFRAGVPALERFPYDVWMRLLNRHWRGQPSQLLPYSDAGGYRPLRAAIAAYLRTARGVRCEPEQVVVVSGAQQAVDLAARLLLDPGDLAWVEDPIYAGARVALAAAGARLVPVPVDEEGLSVAAGIARAPGARLAYITPSHQFPLGVTMSLTRRLDLLAWARRAGAWILEDDYDSEYRYASRPIAALQGLEAPSAPAASPPAASPPAASPPAAADDGGRVIYFGTFSRVLFPALRLGYLVVPPRLVDSFVAAKAAVDRQSPVAEQAVVAELIEEGHFGRHVRRMRTLYRERLEVLLAAVQQDLAGLLDMPRPEAGMSAVGWLPAGADDRAAAAAALAAGVEVTPLSSFYQGPCRRGGLVLGYAGYSPESLRNGVAALAAALSSWAAGSPAR